MPMPMPMPRMIAALLTTVLLLAGCSTPPATTLTAPGAAPKATLQELRVNALLSANSNAATPLDVVIVYDASVLSLLPKSGTEWFAQKPQLMASLAGRIKLVSVHAPPGIAMNVPLPDRHGILQVIVFAKREAQPPANISSYRCALIMISPDSIKTSECRA